jgi:hypothetical protein
VVRVHLKQGTFTTHAASLLLLRERGVELTCKTGPGV